MIRTDTITHLMTTQQKRICRYLIDQSIQNGFGAGYPLEPIAKELGLTCLDLYDNNTNTGVLWELGQHGEGLLYVQPEGEWASVSYDTHELLKHWCAETREERAAREKAAWAAFQAKHSQQ